ncbi:MAG: c-type cytochrome [candidate division NC10 bacterium]|nr:c-type cytochrome [candidate division NC10 bacterium]
MRTVRPQGRCRRAVLGGLAALLAVSAHAGAQTPEGGYVYERHCAVCHGPKGDGNGEAAARLTTKPADLTAGRYKFRSTPSGALPTDEDLLRTVTRGVRGTAMVPQTHLSQAERQLVVGYLKRLSPRFAEPVPPAVEVPPAPAITPDLLARGARVYRASGCPECHGDGGKGDGPSARKGMKDARDLPIVPADLTRQPLKRGSAPEETWKSIALGLDGTPMPSYADALDPADIWALVLFLESLVPQERRHPEDRLLPGEEVLGDQIERQHREGH